MDEQNMELAKILERLAALEKENQSLKAEVEELKSNDIEIKNELNTINRFISAMTESQSIDEIMTEVESAAKQLTNSDEVKFFCMDNTNDKFFSESGGRNWISQEQTEMLKKISDNQEIQNEGTKAYIPLVAGNGNTLGVIAAERSEGFNTDDLARNFAKGGTFVENIKLGLEKEYQHQGRITDELTKMFNRQGLNEYLENTVVKAMSEGKSVNILMSDIDRFKSVNDTYGHDAGDIILKGTAEVMKDFTKDGANNCFRMGGEEMIAILITDTPEQAVDMAETLRKNVEENVNEIMFEGKPMEHSVTVSIGVHAMNPEVTLTRENAREVFDAEFKLADNAVYEAKETGRNKVVCAEEQTYISYLAMKAAEVMAKSGGIEDKGALAELKKTTEDNLVNTENGEIDTVVDALRTCAFQAYDSMPDIAELADMIADKIEAYAEKTAEPAVGIKEAEAPIQNEEAKELTAAVTADISEVKSENVPVGHLEAEDKSAEKISFAEKASAIKDWAEKVNEKAAEKDIQNEQKKGGDSR